VVVVPTRPTAPSSSTPSARPPSRAAATRSRATWPAAPSLHQQGRARPRQRLRHGRRPEGESFDGRRCRRPSSRPRTPSSPRRWPGHKAYPAKADMSKVNFPMLVVLLVILVIYVTMVYAPIGAWLVELFPARIRYTSMSLPTTSATAGSAASCPPSPSPWWRPPVTSTTACGTRSSSR